MDIVLDFMDKNVLTPYVYPASWPEDDIVRQFVSLWAVASVGGALLYLSLATFSWLVVFDHNLRKHPHFLKDQEWQEIKVALGAVPLMGVMTAFFFVAEVRGYSKLYDNPEDFGGIPFLIGSFVSFLMFTDFCIYWIHRWLHLPFFYRTLHKLHHKWKIITPFASHSFHPIDGFLQSVPYHVYPFLFPLQKWVYLGLFMAVNIWTVSIHDCDYRVPKVLQWLINGSAHHTDHHLKFNYNYGEYFTFWDRLFGTFKDPGAYHHDSPHEQLDRFLANGKVAPCVDPEEEAAQEKSKKQKKKD